MHIFNKNNKDQGVFGRSSLLLLKISQNDTKNERLNSACFFAETKTKERKKKMKSETITMKCLTNPNTGERFKCIAPKDKEEGERIKKMREMARKSSLHFGEALERSK